jgi:signal transduction histidine kinase/predicted MFS family arabinose efflux permease
VLLPLWLLVFTSAGQMLVTAPLLPRIREELGASAGSLGGLFAVEAAMMAVFALLIGPVSDRVGRRRVVLAGSGLLAAALASHAVAATLGALFVVRALTGVAGGVLTGAAVSYVADHFPYPRRGWANGWVMSGGAVAQAAGIPAGALLGAAFGFRSAYLMFAALAAVSFALAWRFLPDPGVRRASERLRPGVVLRHYRQLLGRADVRSAGFVYAMLYAASALFIAYLPLWLEAERGARPAEIALLFLAGGVGGALAAPLAGRASDRIGRRRVIVVAVSALALVVGISSLLIARVWVAFPVFFVTMGLLAARAGPLQSLVSSIASDDRRGTLVSLIVAFGQAGFAVGGALAGLVYAAAGYAGTSGLAALALLTAAWVVARALPEPSGRSARAAARDVPGRRAPVRWAPPPRHASPATVAADRADPSHAATGADRPDPAGDEVRWRLRQNRLFIGLPGPALHAAVRVPEVLKVDEDTILCDEGEAPDYLYLIVEGSVRISKRGRRGAQERLAVLEAGDFFGEMGLYDQAARSARATAASPLVVARMDRSALEQVLQLAPLQVSRNVLFGLVRRLRETDAQLIDRVLEAERLSVLGSAAAAIVHDLKDPVSAIQGAAALVRDATDDPQIAKMSGIIQRSVNRMLTMVQEILEFSRGETRLDRTPVSIGELLTAVDEQVLTGTAERGIHIERRVGFHGRLLVDAERVFRVFRNLVGNAVEAMPGGGTLVLGVEREGEFAAFELEDSGPGIPEEIRTTLFEPFATHGKVNGTGLGMAIVKAIVEAHGGRVRVRTGAGAGTCFRFTLPLADP